MCEVTVIATAIAGAVSLGTEIAGGVMEGEAAKHAAQAQADDLEFQAGQEMRNAVLARRQATDTMNIGAIVGGELEAEGRNVAASAKAAFSRNDAALSGSNANLVAASEANAAKDAMRVRANAAREAWGFKREAEERTEQASRLRKAREAVLHGGYLSQVGTGIRTAGRAVNTAVSTVAGAYGGAKKAGL